MPTAIISDIHGNAAALEAVLADIESKGISRVVCLGDVVGYGPEPCQALDMVKERCEWSLMGNHDFGVLYEPTNFNPQAESAAFWTREVFDDEPDDALREARYDYMGRLKVRIVDEIPDGGSIDGVNTFLAVHASPRRPINEYIFPDDAQDAPDKMRSIFDRVEKLCFVGHTHVPGVFTSDNEFIPPAALGDPAVYRFEADEKIVVNVGSVGQPRDLDPRASYVVLYADRVEFARVQYDIDRTADLIKKTPELHDYLGDRLKEGR